MPNLTNVRAHSHHGAKAITAHNTNYLTGYDGKRVSMEILCVDAGTIKVLPNGAPTENEDSYAITFSMAAGEYVPCECKKVYATGTTVTNIVGVFSASAS